MKQGDRLMSIMLNRLAELDMTEAYDVFDVTETNDPVDDYGFVVEYDSKPIYDDMPRWAEALCQEVCDEIVSHLNQLIHQ